MAGAAIAAIEFSDCVNPSTTPCSLRAAFCVIRLVSAGRIAVAEEIEYYWVVNNELREEVAQQLERTRLPKGVVAQIGESIGERRRRRR